MRSKNCLSASVLAALLLALAPMAAHALVGQVTHLSGAVIARGADGQSRLLSLRSEVREGDLIATSDNTYIRIKFSDGGDIVLRPGTQLKIDAYSYTEGNPASDSVALSLLKGGLRSVTGLLARRNPSNFRLTTQTATVGIRGTHFGALLCNADCAGIPNGLHVDVSNGAIVVSTPAGSREFKVGEFGFVPSRNAVPQAVPQTQGQSARVNITQSMVGPPQTRPGVSNNAASCEIK
jgi:hypothetical protein